MAAGKADVIWGRDRRACAPGRSPGVGAGQARGDRFRALREEKPLFLHGGFDTIKKKPVYFSGEDRICGGEDRMNLLNQCQLWTDRGEDRKIVEAIEAIPEAERTPDILSELARAYNNLADGPCLCCCRWKRR